MKRDASRRRRSERQRAIGAEPDRVDPVPARTWTTQGAEASERWLRALGLPAVPRWHAEIAIHSEAGTTFELNIYAEEWGFAFRHGGRTSWIRVTDIPFVHGFDEFDLLARTPDLLGIGVLVGELEDAHGLALRRGDAAIRTNLPNAIDTIVDWLVQPLPYAAVKQAVEPCGDEMHDGIRCTRPKGHDGDHEYRGRDGRGQLRWK